jgi:vacuolar-type H+-ATPase subunit I/STV1
MVPPQGIVGQPAQGRVRRGGIRIRRTGDEAEALRPQRLRQMSWLFIYLGGLAWMAVIAYALWKLLQAMAHDFLPGGSGGLLGCLPSAVRAYLDLS